MVCNYAFLLGTYTGVLHTQTAKNTLHKLSHVRFTCQEYGDLFHSLGDMFVQLLLLRPRCLYREPYMFAVRHTQSYVIRPRKITTVVDATSVNNRNQQQGFSWTPPQFLSGEYLTLLLSATPLFAVLLFICLFYYYWIFYNFQCYKIITNKVYINDVFRPVCLATRNFPGRVQHCLYQFCGHRQIACIRVTAKRTTLQCEQLS